MSNVENDLDIYYAAGNANTQRQENEITAIVDTKNQFSNLYLFWEKELVINTVDI